MLLAIACVSLTACHQPDAVWHGDLPSYEPGDSTELVQRCPESAVAYLSVYPTAEDLLRDGDDDEASAWLWFHATYPGAHYLSFSEVSAERLSPLHTLFWIRDIETGDVDDVLTMPQVVLDAVPALSEWYRSGGNIVLWGHAVLLAEHLGRLPEGTYSTHDFGCGCGLGGYNADSWMMAVCIDSPVFCEDFSTHPLYEGIATFSRGEFRGINVIGPGWKEDHNCVCFGLPAEITRRSSRQEICYTLLTDYFGIYPLGTWDSAAGEVSQLNIYELRQGQTDYRGRILCIGNGGCEFSMNNPDGTKDVSAFPRNNCYQTTILRLAHNAVQYLRIL